MKILVIEDEGRILSFLTRGLEAEGYSVEASRNGREGLSRALDGGWDLVLLDLLLPGLNGLEVLEALQRLQPELPVLVLSARGDLPTKLRGFDLGATDYMTKPVALDELLARVRVQLRKRSGPGERPVNCGNLELDVARRQARVGEIACDLSDREFRLLLHLVRHA